MGGGRGALSGLDASYLLVFVRSRTLYGTVEGLFSGSLGLEGRGSGVRSWLPAPTLVSMDAGAVLTGPWQQVRGPRKAPWRGWACFFSIAQRPSASCCQLCFPQGRHLIFSWQRTGCWEGRREPASFLVEPGGLGHGCSCPLGDWGPILLSPELVTLRKGLAARSPAGDSRSQRPQPVP